MINHSNTQPSKYWLKFFRWFCNPDYVEDIEGDLLERFDKRIEVGKNAHILFVRDVLQLFRPGIIKSFEGAKRLNYYGMFKHNIILTFRNFKRYKSTFLINLTGLSTGLACVLFIYLWIADEVSMDKYHENDSLLYQVRSNHHTGTEIFTWRGVPGLLFDEIQASVPEVKHAVVATEAHEYKLSVRDEFFKVNGKFGSDDFLKVFTHSLVEGDARTALQDRSSILITESLAKRLFGSTDVIGSTVNFHFWENDQALQVTGVLKDLPKNTSAPFEFVMSWDYYHNVLISNKQWQNYYARIMLVLNDAEDVIAVEKKVDAILKENQENNSVDLFLTKYSGQYLYGNYENGVIAGGRIEYVRLFSVVAFFILFIACINFINLSTANASKKTKEIGVKKSMGASRESLMSQFFTESILLSLIALVVGFTLVMLLLPQFNMLTQKQLTLEFDSALLIASLLMVLVVGVLAGSYPALYLSGMNVLRVLKPNAFKFNSHNWGRKVLVIVQYAISIVLIVSALFIHKQMDFIKNKNLGYSRDNVIYFEREGKLLENYDAFVNEVKNTRGVDRAALSGFMVGGANSTRGVQWEGKPEENQIQFWETRSGYGTIELLNIEMVKGRDFSEAFGSDSSSIIFNEAAIAAMGLKDPIGKTVKHYSGEKKIIGVVKDFNIMSLHEEVGPALFLYTPERTHFVMAKLTKGLELETLGALEKVYEKFNPGYPFSPIFLDQDYQALYASEERVADLSGYFAVLAILISCLGLFGLATFTTQRRVKEIGIRKVLGCEAWRITFLLTKDFTKMVFVSIIIGLPISYFIGLQWLENFAYNIKLEWWFFFGAGIAALLISWLTVGSQTVKAALANPVESLKDE